MPGLAGTQRFREHDDSTPAPLPDWWDGASDPLVYVTFGSVAPQRDDVFPELFRAVIEALAPLPLRVLVTIGRDRDPAQLGAPPANVHVERWVPQASVMPHARAMVSHGGTVTMRAGLAAGIPQVVLPLFADQPDNAARVDALGAGIAVEAGAASERCGRRRADRARRCPFQRARRGGRRGHSSPRARRPRRSSPAPARRRGRKSPDHRATPRTVTAPNTIPPCQRGTLRPRRVTPRSTPTSGRSSTRRGAPRRHRRPRLRADRLRHHEPRGDRRAARARRPRCSSASPTGCAPPAPRSTSGSPSPRTSPATRCRSRASASRAGRSSRRACAAPAAAGRCCSTATSTSCPPRREDGWEHDPFDPQVRDGVIVGRGTCDMKGGIAAMVVAAEALAATGALRGDVIVCTNTDEESSGVGGLACARHGVSRRLRDRPEPTGARGLAGLPRQRLLHDRACRAAPATPSRSTRTGARAAPSTRSRRRASCSTASTGCALDWRSAPDLRHAAARPAGHPLHALRRRRRLARHDPRPRRRSSSPC